MLQFSLRVASAIGIEFGTFLIIKTPKLIQTGTVNFVSYYHFTNVHAKLFIQVKTHNINVLKNLFLFFLLKRRHGLWVAAEADT